MANQYEIAQRKQQLLNEMAAARAAMTHHGAELKQCLQIKPLVQNLIMKKPKALFAGSAVAGLITTLFFRRPKKIQKVNQTKGAILLSWGLSLIKPVATTWVINQAKKATSSQPSVR